MEVKDGKPTIFYFGRIFKKQSTLFGVTLLINILAIFVGSTGASKTGSASLDITNLQDVLTSLREVHFGSDKWRDLGLELGLFDNRLRGIEANKRGDVDECLRECLSKWLARVDQVDEKGGATWAALAKALRKIGDKPAAEHIEKSYGAGVSKSQNQAQSSSTTQASHEDTESCAADITGKAAKAAIRENKGELIKVLSRSEPVFRDIVSDCEAKGLITSSEATDLLDTMKGGSLQVRAGQLIQLVQTLAEYRPTQLYKFLSILQEKGNPPVQAVAEDISEELGEHCKS